MAARSPARSMAGPEVTCRPTPISVATMPARVVLPRPGRAGEEQVVGGLAPPAGGLEDDLEVLLELGLADELVEGPRPQARTSATVTSASSSGRLGPQQLVAHAPAYRRAAASRWSASRSRAAGVAVVGQVGA